ncbi:HAD family hydrolase [Candidatus Saccharibacteria bacterium]|jgi:FMN phosphatase YigB (HAD superfamily)|nr:HAD family hydrolase [Candidatus Saccharibacteria bacterium]
MMINHIWFDFSETIGTINRERHTKLKYSEYAGVVGRQVSDELKLEFDSLYEKHHHSTSDIFYKLGKSSDWWSSRIATIPPSELYKLADNNVPEVLVKLGEILPISIFSNLDLKSVLPVLNIDSSLFTHILSAGMVKKPKPAIDGFSKIIELSNLAAEEILYIGDKVQKDIIPAKKTGLKAGIIFDKSKEADYSFGSFDEILDFIKLETEQSL